NSQRTTDELGKTCGGCQAVQGTQAPRIGKFGPSTLPKNPMEWMPIPFLPHFVCFPNRPTGANPALSSSVGEPAMDGKTQNVKRICAASGRAFLLAAGFVLFAAGRGELEAVSFFAAGRERYANCGPACASGHDSFAEEMAGTWYWLRSPE